MFAKPFPYKRTCVPSVLKAGIAQGKKRAITGGSARVRVSRWDRAAPSTHQRTVVRVRCTRGIFAGELNQQTHVLARVCELESRGCARHRAVVDPRSRDSVIPKGTRCPLTHTIADNSYTSPAWGRPTERSVPTNRSRVTIGTCGKLGSEAGVCHRQGAQKEQRYCGRHSHVNIGSFTLPFEAP